jgi:hypothetical protein
MSGTEVRAKKIICYLLIEVSGPGVKTDAMQKSIFHFKSNKQRREAAQPDLSY